ncbi:MAG: helix-turn-helix transcriptional regulator [Ruminococcaceae bacterium]|nr:helix-turn-helix transcriptional regulator [Oscillospiraceae bacterium]
MEFNEIIRELREVRKLNQTQLGTILNMHQMKISRMETGTAEPSLNDIRALCLFYNVSADYLLGLPDLPYPKR